MTDSLSARIATGGYLAAPGHTRVNFIPDEFRKTVNALVGKVEALREKHPEIEALAACGHSGTMLMGALSYMTGLPQIAIRKSTAGNVSDRRMVNGWLGCKGYLIIDDLVDSGGTVDRIVREITAQTKTLVNNINERRQYLGDDHPKRNVVEPVCIPEPVAILIYQNNNQQEIGAVLDGEAIDIPMYSIHRDNLDMPAPEFARKKWTPERCELSKRLEEAREKRETQVVLAIKNPFDDVILTEKIQGSNPCLTLMDVAESFEVMGNMDLVSASSRRRMIVTRPRASSYFNWMLFDDSPANLGGFADYSGFRPGQMNVLYNRRVSVTAPALKEGASEQGPDPPDALLYLMRTIWK